MNMISQIRKRIVDGNQTIITLDEFNQLQAEWITRTKIDYEDNYIVALEDFMKKVAKETKCLPSFADPRPDGDNRHIINKIRQLVKNTPNNPVE